MKTISDLDSQLILNVKEAIQDKSLIPLSKPNNDLTDFALSLDEETFYSLSSEFYSGKEQDQVVSILCQEFPDFS